MLPCLAKCLKCPADIFRIGKTYMEVSVANALFHIHSYSFLPFGNIEIKLEEKLSTLEDVSEIEEIFRVKRKNLGHNRRDIVKHELRVGSY